MDFDNLARIRMLPLDELRLLYPDENEYTFRYPEADSSAAIDEILEPNSEGAVDVAALRFSLTWFVPYNDFETMRFALAQINADKPERDMTVTFRAQDEQAGGGTLRMDFTRAELILDISAGWRMETVEMRPRIVLRVSCLFLPELIGFGEDADPGRLFHQEAGWD
jgi:hypothetical protein